jgi:hypothetical protein
VAAAEEGRIKGRGEGSEEDESRDVLGRGRDGWRF